MATQRSDSLAGAVVGVFGGLLIVIFPIVGVVAVLVFAALTLRQSGRLLA